MPCPANPSSGDTADEPMTLDTPVVRSHDPARATVTTVMTGRAVMALTSADAPRTGPALRRTCLTEPSSRSPSCSGPRGMIPGLALRVRA